MTAATTSLTAEAFRQILVPALHPSPTNPRQSFDVAALKELQTSIVQSGIVEPLVVRPLKREGAYEIVAGERRWRAAKAAGLERVPCVVRELTDTQVLKLQLVENLQRDDLQPLEEADAFARALDLEGETVATLAAVTGKSERHIYDRLALRKLPTSAKARLTAGEITAGHAVEVARLQPKDQRAALAFLANRHPSVRELRTHLETQIFRSLSAAPWKHGDAELVPAAGACTTCPKNSVNEPGADKRQQPRCRDAGCYAGKLTAFLHRRKQELANEHGAVVLVSGSYGGSAAGGLTRSDWEPVSAKRRCKHAVAGLVTDGRDDVGRVIQVCLRKDKCRTHYPYLTAARANTSWQRQEAAARKKREAATTRRRRLFDAVRARLAKTPMPNITTVDGRFLARGILEECHYTTAVAVCRARGLAPPRGKRQGFDYRNAVRRAIAAADASGAMRLAFELLMGREVDQDTYYGGSGWKPLTVAARRWHVRTPAAPAKKPAKRKARRKAFGTRHPRKGRG